jgi:bifunctional non-homologous end joining protein LigD
VAAAVGALPAREALLDGELAVLQPDGTTSFQSLQNLLGKGSREGTLTYFVFDLLHLDGHDLTRAPLHARKALLRALLQNARDGVLRFSEHVEGDGRAFQAEACRLGLEGIVSKRREAPYTPGRGRDWLKAKCRREQELVIGGYTLPQGARVGIGALLLGVHDPAGRLQYAGKVGTGFTQATLRALARRLTPLERKSSPFAGRVEAATRVRWVAPELVAQVAFTEWTGDGKLRHPVFRGLREDKPAREVVRERAASTLGAAAEPVPGSPDEKAVGLLAAARGSPGPAATEGADLAAEATATAALSEAAPPAERRPQRSGAPRSRPAAKRRGEPAEQVEGVRLTHPDRVLYPLTGTTKDDLARYLLAVAPRLLPHLRGRPTTLVRCPEGLAGECFFQKHVGFWAPEALQRVRIQEARKLGEYLVVNDRPGLVGLAQLGILEIHTWNTRIDHLELPDRLVFDLDPDASVPWERVRAAARRVRGRLLELDLESFVKTTGGKGLHVVVPLQRAAGWDEAARFAESVARDLAREQPELYVAEMSKALRRGRIFIDWLRNHRGATSIEAWSTRARPRAPVAVPLAWEELDEVAAPDAWTVTNAFERLRALARDPWAGYTKARQRLNASRLKAAGVS